MNPLLSFWIKVQPLSGGLLGNHTWKAFIQSSALAQRAEQDWEDPVVARQRNLSPYSPTTLVTLWAYDGLRGVFASVASSLRSSASAWLLTPTIMRMQDEKSSASLPRLSRTAICQAGKDMPGSRESTARKTQLYKHTKRFSTEAVTRNNNNGPLTPLQLSHDMLQRQENAHSLPTLIRRNSREWIQDYKTEARIDKINYKNIFGGVSDTSTNEIPTLPPITTEEDDSTSKYHYFAPGSPTTSSITSVDSALSLPELERIVCSSPFPESIISSTPEPIHSSSSPTAISTEGPCSSLSSFLGICHQTTHQPNYAYRTVSEVEVSAPRPDDVICGRGGKANTHPGNISFREEAKKLRTWYESSSKSEKFTISAFLVDVVRERGGRFLKRDSEVKGGGLEADNDDVRKKASQALREGRCR